MLQTKPRLFAEKRRSGAFRNCFLAGFFSSDAEQEIIVTGHAKSEMRRGRVEKPSWSEHVIPDCGVGCSDPGAWWN